MSDRGIGGTISQVNDINPPRPSFPTYIQSCETEAETQDWIQG